jgi:hypothetical protein
MSSPSRIIAVAADCHRTVGGEVGVATDFEVVLFDEPGEDVVGPSDEEPAAAGVEKQRGGSGAWPAGPLGAPVVQGDRSDLGDHLPGRGRLCGELDRSAVVADARIPPLEVSG